MGSVAGVVGVGETSHPGMEPTKVWKKTMGFEVGVWCAFSPVSTAFTSTLKEEFSGICATVKVSVFLSALTVGAGVPVTDCEKPLATSWPAPGVSAEAIEASSKVAPWGALTVIVALFSSRLVAA